MIPSDTLSSLLEANPHHHFYTRECHAVEANREYIVLDIENTRLIRLTKRSMQI